MEISQFGGNKNIYGVEVTILFSFLYVVFVLFIYLHDPKGNLYIILLFRWISQLWRF